MRELALISIRIVDEKDRLYSEEVNGWFVNEGGKPAYAEDFMDLIERPKDHPGVDVHQTSDSIEPQLKPIRTLTLIKVEPCNIDSALEFLFKECDDLNHCFGKIERAGHRLLESENKRREELNEMSKLLSGDGVELTETIQFYAVFQMVNSGTGYDAETRAVLEGVLRLDKLDMAIDEAILL